ncbi:Nn.00g092400.m01.CDS01 [Neocucurbitaria sp. VM-36]
MAVHWEKSPHTSFTLWDIDREFQNAHDAYEQWQAKNRRRRPLWACFGVKSQDDTLSKALRLGRQVQRLMETGKELFGSRFEQGDSKCHTVLSAQLLRLQYEVRQPLYDSALSPTSTPIPYDDIIRTAKSIRRTCLNALREQYARCDSRTFTPVLPPPRFKVDFCPFANQLRKDVKENKSSSLRTKKVRSKDRHDDREICPDCDACISVTAHSGIPDYRYILFTSHIARDAKTSDDKATFACSSCYKTFDDSYAFLDHVFQKQIGSEKSCLRITTSGRWTINRDFMESDPSLVEQCLKNCLMRELTRVRTQKMMKSQVVVRQKDIHPAERYSTPFASLETLSST